MTLDINFVLLTVMVTCIAFVGAVNAKGSTKMLVSYLLAFICLAITAFYLSQHIAAASKQRTSQIAGEIKEELIKMETDEDLLEDSEEELEKQEKQKELEDYKKQANEILVKIREINQKVSRFRLETDTDDEYERQSGQASFYLGEISRHKKTVQSLIAPEEMRTVHEKLVEAANTQQYTCSKLKRYFNAEDSSEERQVSRVYRSKNSQAASLLSNLEMDLR
jgi:lipopolysaccharide export LptBFGC system permease protein LptF